MKCEVTAITSCITHQ